jgi:predicted nucleic acid-binding protein
VAGLLFVCPIGELEQLYSARSAADYDVLKADLHARFETVGTPADIFDRALRLQRDLARHHGMWHRTPIPDLLIAETALHHGLGVVTVDADFERIAEVRPLVVRRLKR